MKGSQFKRNPSAIRFRREEAAKKKRSYGRWFYLAVIWGVIGYGLFLLLSRTWILHRDGQVRFIKVDVGVLEPGRVKEIFVAEGDEVKAGDPLFTVRYERDQKVSKRDWVTREKLEAQSRIAEQEVRVAQALAEVDQLKSDLKRIEEDVLLELRDPGRIHQIRNRLEDAERKVVGTRAQLLVYREQLTRINQVPEEELVPTGKINETMVAPTDGTITRIGKELEEAAYPSENIVSIHKQDEVFIRAFFEQSDVKYLEVGDHVEIILPGGRSSPGIIRRFYSATFPLPPEFQPRYEPTQRSIVVDIDPLWGEEISENDYFYKMSVRIRKYRWEFPWQWF